jgi:serine protease
MVMLVDVAADQPASTGTEEYALSEAEWVKVATGEGTPESPHAPDVLVIAPAGQRPALSYPAALPGVVAVSGHKCSGEALHEHHPSDSRQPDVSAPGEGVGIPGSDKTWTDDTAAAAVVAGAAARLWSAHPSCSAEDIKAALKVTASEGQVAWLSLAAAEAALQLSGCASGGGGQVASTSERLNPTV